MGLSELCSKIETHTARLGVIGLGYVGLPVAALYAEAGFQVTGIDIQPERVNQINQGLLPIEGDEPGLADLLNHVVLSGRLQAITCYADLRKCDIVLIAVETPIAANHQPQYAALKAALQSLGAELHPGMLVVVESTIAPRTMSALVQPILESISGLRAGVDFFLGHCPERVMPGKLLSNLRNLSRVVGGQTPETASVMAVLYRQIVHADLDETDLVTAELVKTTENAYRDVQIAFANEVALICEAAGGDVWRVRELANKTPYRSMHLPGAGVGGHCIPKDPWLLAYSVHASETPLRLIPAARAVNESMPYHIADLLSRALQQSGLPTSNARVLVLGFAYLEESDDTRNSPSAALVSELSRRGIASAIHDPYVSPYQGDILSRAAGCQAAVLMVRHREYANLDLGALANSLTHPLLIDGRNLYTPEQAQAAGIQLWSLGRSHLGE